MSEDPPILVSDLSAAIPGLGDIAGATSIGPVRGENQDVYEAVALPGGAAALLVADGMGGLAGGGEAARAAADGALAALADHPEAAAAALHRANRGVATLRERIGGHPGTTLTHAVISSDGDTVVAHAGDSRAYLVRGGAATVLTSDHSWVGEQVRAGVLQAGAERRHPRRNVITMAVMGDELDPEVLTLRLARGDHLLLCSDGFWEPLTDEHIAELVSTAGPLPAVTARAVEAALAAGASDNVTVLVVRLG